MGPLGGAYARGMSFDNWRFYAAIGFLAGLMYGRSPDGSSGWYVAAAGNVLWMSLLLIAAVRWALHRAGWERKARPASEVAALVPSTAPPAVPVGDHWSRGAPWWSALASRAARAWEHVRGPRV